MYLCYVDESGTPDIPGNSNHFVLAGISIPIGHWRAADQDISTILRRWGLVGQELHTTWILRSYREQSLIPDFQNLSWDQRRAVAKHARARQLRNLKKTATYKLYKRVRKNYDHTQAYVHLTRDDREQFVREVADCVAGWGCARLFAECVDKRHFDHGLALGSVGEHAFEQVVSRFEQYLASIESPDASPCHGLIVHDNNETVAKRHTGLMRRFHEQGTLFTKIERIIETPLFVDSSLTSMVQVADLCAYALRRYVENQETDLFTRIFTRARCEPGAVGVGHYAPATCTCEICRCQRLEKELQK